MTADTRIREQAFDYQVAERLLFNRIVVIGAEIDDTLANLVCGQLILLAAEDARTDIRVYINSPGGSISAGMAIYDTMQYIPNDVATYAMGMAASMAHLLLCAGAPGKRYALPHARVMMHQPSGGVGGTASDIKIQAEQLIYTKRKTAELIAFHTGRSVEEIIADFDRDRWFTADAACEYGFVDHVVHSVATVGAVGASRESH